MKALDSDDGDDNVGQQRIKNTYMPCTKVYLTYVTQTKTKPKKE